MRFSPWQVLAVMVAGAMSQHDREVINYLREENRVLREKLGPKRVLLNDDQRRRLRTVGPTRRGHCVAGQIVRRAGRHGQTLNAEQ